MQINCKNQQNLNLILDVPLVMQGVRQNWTLTMYLRNRSLFESILSLSLLNALNLVLPLITLPYLIRIVGIANYGAYSIAYAIVQYMLLISTYGFNFSATKQIAQHREDRKRINNIFNATIAAKLWLSIAAIVVLGLVTWAFFPITYLYMTLLGVGIVIGDSLNPVWLFQGMEKMRYMTLVNFVSKFLFTILIFFFIQKQGDYIYITLLNSAGFLISGIISLGIACKLFEINFFLPSYKEVASQLKDGWFLFLSTIFMNLYRNSNVFILGFFVPEAQVGIYAGAEKVIKASQSIASPISNALFPYLAASFKQGCLLSKIKKIQKIAWLMGGILLVLSSMIWFLAPFINDFLLSGASEKTIDLIRLMVPVVFFGGLNYILGIVGLVNLGYQSAFFKFVMYSGILSVVFMFSTVSFWGNYSATMALCLSEIVLFVMCFYELRILRKQ